MTDDGSWLLHGLGGGIEVCWLEGTGSGERRGYRRGWQVDASAAIAVRRVLLALQHGPLVTIFPWATLGRLVGGPLLLTYADRKSIRSCGGWFCGLDMGSCGGVELSVDEMSATVGR